MFVIEEELKKLPALPGVYLMRDSGDGLLYVGKAINLRNRVRQYFQSSRDKTEKIRRMVAQIDHFEYIVTGSELEALVLECNLIKEHSPRYNTLLKDDKSYPYIRVTVNEEFPRVLFSRTMKRDHSRYFGPYTSVGAVRDTLDLLHRIYQIRTCSRSLPRDIGKERPCLNYHIHRCEAPCQGRVSREEYRAHVEKAMSFLKGDYDEVLHYLEENMQASAAKLDFEEAVRWRELLFSVQKIAQKQRITDSDMEDRDIIGYALGEEDAVVQIFFMRQGRMIGRDHFHLRTPRGELGAELLSGFLKQFYAGTPYIPREIYLQQAVPDQELLAAWLTQKRGMKVSLIAPKKGEKVRLVELARDNARMVLEKDRDKLSREEKRTRGAVRELEEWLGLTGLTRLEAYDISNTSGVQSYGSLVVYEEGRPKRSDYRKFRIRSVRGPNDYASMEELLTRRFAHGLAEREQEEKTGQFSRFPDLILIDGGLGQVHIAEHVLSELGLCIPVCGMVKDETHRTRGLLYKDKEIQLDPRAEGFLLLSRIQEEVHRFAVESHRRLRGKAQLHSVLEEIPYIGPRRRLALMRAFGDIAAIRGASLSELLQVEGLSAQAAESVYRFFHEEESKSRKERI